MEGFALYAGHEVLYLCNGQGQVLTACIDIEAVQVRQSDGGEVSEEDAAVVVKQFEVVGSNTVQRAFQIRRERQHSLDAAEIAHEELQVTRCYLRPVDVQAHSDVTGIVAEVVPERLSDFFSREVRVYAGGVQVRVRQRDSKFGQNDNRVVGFEVRLYVRHDKVLREACEPLVFGVCHCHGDSQLSYFRVQRIF